MKTLILFLVVLVAAFSIITWYFLNVPSANITSTELSDKLRTCPDEWIRNKMPGMVPPGAEKSNKTNDYFIVNGERRELKEFDMNWVQNNCPNLQPQEVY